MDAGQQPRPMRPNDPCTAAYYNDVKKLKELFTVAEVPELPPLPEEFDPSAPEEPEEEDPELAQERAEIEAQNTQHVRKLLDTCGLLVTRLTPVDTRQFGLSVTVRMADDGSGVCAPTFKVSEKSAIAAPPLLWAVLGRSHEAVAFLVAKGADVEQQCPVLNVTAEDVAVANKSLQTVKVLHQSSIARAEQTAADEEKVAARARTIAERATLVEEHRLREEEAARAEEEAEAAGEEGDDGMGPGDDDGEEYDE